VVRLVTERMAPKGGPAGDLAGGPDGRAGVEEPA